MAKSGSVVVAGLVLVVMVVLIGSRGAEGLSICNMDSTKLAECLPAIRGPSPSPPSAGCCEVMRSADLHCLCGYKDSLLLPSFGVDPKLAMALPKKCLLNPPPECQEP